MKNAILAVTAALALAAVPATARNPMVGGAAMYPTKTVNGPAELSVSTSPAALTAATRVV